MPAIATLAGDCSGHPHYQNKVAETIALPEFWRFCSGNPHHQNKVAETVALPEFWRYPCVLVVHITRTQGYRTPEKSLKPLPYKSSGDSVLVMRIRANKVAETIALSEFWRFCSGGQLGLLFPSINARTIATHDNHTIQLNL